MSYLLDSNVIISWLDGDFEIRAKVRSLVPLGVFISAISVVEVEHGLLKKQASTRSEFERLLEFVPIIDVDRTIAARCAAIRLHIESIGNKFRHRPLDLLIASTAIVHSLTLVTADLAHVRDVPGLHLLPSSP